MNPLLHAPQGIQERSSSSSVGPENCVVHWKPHAAAAERAQIARRLKRVN
jgi:hypothetical protein